MIKYECLTCNKDYSNKIDEELKNRFKSTIKFSINDINKFILLRKVVYPYAYMNVWEEFNETKLPEKKSYSNVNMEDITYVDYIQKEFVEILKRKN